LIDIGNLYSAISRVHFYRAGCTNIALTSREYYRLKIAPENTKTDRQIAKLSR